MALFKIPRKPKEEKLYKLPPGQRAELERIEGDAVADFQGELEELESALGMLRMGHHVGWKVLYLLHSKRTIRKYEDILTGDSKTPVRIRELFKESGPSSYRSNGYRLAEAASNFWKIISGDTKIPDRRQLEK